METGSGLMVASVWGENGMRMNANKMGILGCDKMF